MKVIFSVIVSVASQACINQAFKALTMSAINTIRLTYFTFFIFKIFSCTTSITTRVTDVRSFATWRYAVTVRTMPGTAYMMVNSLPDIERGTKFPYPKKNKPSEVYVFFILRIEIKFVSQIKYSGNTLLCTDFYSIGQIK